MVRDASDTLQKAQHVSRILQTKTIIEIDYKEYFNSAGDTITYSVVVEEFYSAELQLELENQLGADRAKFYISIPDFRIIWTEENHGVIEEPIEDIENGVSQLIKPPCRFALSRISNTEFESTLLAFELNLQETRRSIGPLSIAFSHPPSPEATEELLLIPNKAHTRILFLDVLRDVVDLMLKIKVPVGFSLSPPIPGTIKGWKELGLHPPPSDQDIPAVFPDLVIRGSHLNLEMRIPVKVKKNLKCLVAYLESPTGLIMNKHYEPFSIVQQCFQYAIQLESAVFILTDYFHTVYMEIDLEKSLEDINLVGDGQVLDMYIKHRIVRNTDSKLTMKALITWVIYDRFRMKTKREIIKERTRLKDLVKAMWRPGTDVKSKQLRKYSKVLETLKTHSNKHLELNLENMNYVMMQNFGHSRVLSIPFQNFKELFSPDVQEQGIDEVVLKIFNPLNLQNPRHDFRIIDSPHLVDEAMAVMLRHAAKEVHAYRKIDAYNKRTRSKMLKINVPQLLDYGSLVIYDQMDYVWHIGYYITLSKIKHTREYLPKDLPKLNKQVNLLSERALIEHGDLAKPNIIVSDDGDDVYLIDFANSVDIGHPMNGPASDAFS